MADNPLFGAGLGMTKTAVVQLMELIFSEYGVVVTNPKLGIDSFIIVIMLEQGLVGMVALFYSFFCLNKCIIYLIKAENRSSFLGLVCILGFSSLMSALLITGYRGLLHLWMFFPSAMVGVHQLNRRISEVGK